MSWAGERVSEIAAEVVEVEGAGPLMTRIYPRKGRRMFGAEVVTASTRDKND